MATVKHPQTHQNIINLSFLVADNNYHVTNSALAPADYQFTSVMQGHSSETQFCAL